MEQLPCCPSAHFTCRKHNMHKTLDRLLYWSTGVMAAMAMVDLSASRRSATLSTSKRWVWRACAPCSRTMR